MSKYLLIESRDPFDSNDTRFYCDLARQLVAANNEVTVFLVQNGVLPARAGARSGDLASLAGAGVGVLADSFSLKERGIDAGKSRPRNRGGAARRRSGRTRRGHASDLALKENVMADRKTITIAIMDAPFESAARRRRCG